MNVLYLVLALHDQCIFTYLVLQLPSRETCYSQVLVFCSHGDSEYWLMYAPDLSHECEHPRKKGRLFVHCDDPMHTQSLSSMRQETQWITVFRQKCAHLDFRLPILLTRQASSAYTMCAAWDVIRLLNYNKRIKIWSAYLKHCRNHEEKRFFVSWTG